MPKVPAANRFQQLVDDISRGYVKARRAQVRFVWETGRRIVEEEQNGAMRSAYGSALIPTLARALTAKFGSGFSENALRKTRQFYLQNPIQPISVELDWSDYVELLPVKDLQTRRRLERRIIREGLTSLQIRQLVRRAREPELRGQAAPPATAHPASALKRPSGLKLRTYGQITGPAASLYRPKPGAGQILLDCGFFVLHAVSRAGAAKVTVTDSPSYTYAAVIERVVDGDTLKVVIDLGFGIAVREKLRLKGIDTPELGTPEGEKAKRHVARLLPPGSPIILRSHKTDLYGRFVADVFYRKGVNGAAAAPEAILKDGTYLNQHLLDKALAVRME